MTLAEPDRRAKRRAVAAAVAANAFFAVMDALVKALTADYPVMQVVCLRAGVSLVIVLAILPWFGGMAALRMTRVAAHMLRVGYALIATACFFYAFRHLPLADVYVVGHSAPFFVTLLAIFLLGERVGPRRWAAVAAGFVGVVIVLEPWSAGHRAGADWTPWAASVGAAFFYALAAVQIRALSGSATALGMVALFLAAATLAGGAVSWSAGWVAVAPKDLALVAAMGVMGVGGQVFMTLAYRLGPAGLAAPFEYTGLIWATGLGYMWFGDIPTLAVIVGGAVVIASGVYIYRREAV